MAEGRRQRMRERFYSEGIDNFEPHEALEMLLYFSIPRRDTNELAHKLIDKFGSFHAVLEADRKALTDFGITENTTALINMIPAFSNYYLKSRANGTPTLSNLTDIGNFVLMKLGTRKNEVFALLLLDSQKHYINFEIIEHGTVSSTTVSPRKVAESVLRNNAVNVVFVHNHPGGSLQASVEDKILTKNLASLLNAIGARLMDHIIIANGRFSSMIEMGAI